MAVPNKHTSGRENEVGPALTRKRGVVLQVVRSSTSHLTANEVFNEARKLMPNISFATVYNSLRFLRDSGLIHEITFGSGASRFDRRTARHDHAICNRCGKLEDFELPEIVELARVAAMRSNFEPETVHLTLVGVCPDCRAG